MDVEKNDNELKQLIKQLLENQGFDRKLENEYTELGIAIRHYSALRFAILTIFCAFVGGLMAGFVTLKLNPVLIVLINIIGTLGAFVFIIYELRLSTYMGHFETRATELENKLGYNLYSGRRKRNDTPTLISFPLATKIFYISVMVFWMISLFL